MVRVADARRATIIIEPDDDWNVKLLSDSPLVPDDQTDRMTTHLCGSTEESLKHKLEENCLHRKIGEGSEKKEPG